MGSSRLEREKETIQSMVEIFCMENHKEEGLCTSCRELLEYSIMRLTKCSFRDQKPVCLKCKVHCYKQEMRDKVRQVMRYSGKRMIWVHPLLAIRHLLDSIN